MFRRMTIGALALFATTQNASAGLLDPGAMVKLYNESPNVNTIQLQSGFVTTSHTESLINSCKSNYTFSFTDSTITVTNNFPTSGSCGYSKYGDGTFGGYELVFAGVPDIIGVDWASGLAPVGITFTSNTIYINFEGERRPADAPHESSVFNVAFSTPASAGVPESASVPEPATAALMGGGVLGMCMMRRRKRKGA